MSHLFLSYSRTDSVLVEHLAVSLEHAGHSVWLDKVSLTPGTEQWKQAIETAIENADVVIVYLTPQAKSSRWVSLEVSYAREMGRPILPILAEGNSRSAIPIDLIETQWIDGTGDEDAALEELLATLQRTVTGKVLLAGKAGVEPPQPHTGLAFLPWLFVASLICAWVGSLALAGTLAHDFDAAYISAAVHRFFYSLTLTVFFVGASFTGLAGAVSLAIKFTPGVLQGWLWPVVAAFLELLLVFGAIRLFATSGMGNVMSDFETLLALLALATLGPTVLTITGIFTLRQLGARRTSLKPSDLFRCQIAGERERS